ncbi:hypothetical protein D3C87_189240 [compost metagenome]
MIKAALRHLILATFCAPFSAIASVTTLDNIEVGTPLSVQQDIVIHGQKLDLLFQRGSAINNPRDQYDNSMGCWITMASPDSSLRVIKAGTAFTITQVEFETKAKRLYYSFVVQNDQGVQSLDCWKNFSTSEAWTPMTIFDFDWTFGDYLSDLSDL